jgi:hypothetical protein
MIPDVGGAAEASAEEETGSMRMRWRVRRGEVMEFAVG